LSGVAVVKWLADRKFSPEETVKEDVALLRESSFFKGMQVVGLVQDTETGLLRECVGIE
jgi:carbonic anhydrase